MCINGLPSTDPSVIGYAEAMDLEAVIARVGSECDDPRAGLYGPESLSWRLGREAVLFLGAGRASLLQLAHPWVAHAVDQHSATRNDPIARFNRTFQSVYAMVFGDLEAVITSARQVGRIHQGIRGEVTETVGQSPRGQRYHALDPDAEMWVLCTLVEGSVQAYELVVSPLSEAEKETYYREAQRFGWLFGIPPEHFPPDWGAFQRWSQQMQHEVLAVGSPAREIADILFTPPHLAATPYVRWFRTMTAGLMPPHLREPYGLAWGRRDRLVFRGAIRAMRQSWPLLPGRIRFVPAWHEAQSRLQGEQRRDHIGRALEQAVLLGLAPRGEGPRRSWLRRA